MHYNGNGYLIELDTIKFSPVITKKEEDILWQSFKMFNILWRSINLPITEEIMTTGEGIVENNLNDDIYYNRKSNIHSQRIKRLS